MTVTENTESHLMVVALNYFYDFTDYFHNKLSEDCKHIKLFECAINNDLKPITIHMIGKYIKFMIFFCDSTDN